MQDVQASYGRDVEDVFEQIQAEKEIAAEYGINMNFEPFGKESSKEVQNEDTAGNSEEN